MESSKESSVAMETDAAVGNVTQEDELNFVKDEYCVQYFGFDPQYFMNGMYNAVSEYLQEAIDTLNDTIINTFKDKICETKLKEMSKQRTQVAVDRLNLKFDKAEIYLNKNIFNIPDHLVLPSDQAQVDSPCSEEEMLGLDQEIQDVTDKIIAVKSANAQLLEKWETLTEVQQEVTQLTESMDQVLATVAREAKDVTEESRKLRMLSSLVDKTVLSQSES